MLWHLIHIVDILLWLFMAASVLYILFFALVSTLWKKRVEEACIASYYVPYRQSVGIKKERVFYISYTLPRLQRRPGNSIVSAQIPRTILSL